MTPLPIGACLMSDELPTYRDWLFGADRDIEIQDFYQPELLMGDWKDHAAGIRAALDGHNGRVGMHGPFVGLDLACGDPGVRAIVTERMLTGIAIAEAIGAVQMVIHSPCMAWFHRHRHFQAGYVEALYDRVHLTMDPVVTRAEAAGVTLVLENIEDPDPADRRALVESFNSDRFRLSIDTGHAHLARGAYGAPPVDYFVRDAGAMLHHVHIQDADGHADRHWQIGLGNIDWPAVFAALAELDQRPHLVLELRDKAGIPASFDYLVAAGLAC